MKLSNKLFVSFAVVILLVGGIGVTSSYINESIKDQVTSESKVAMEEIELAGEMGIQLFRSLTRTQYLLENPYRKSLSTDFSEGGMSNEVVRQNIDESLQKFRESIEATKGIIKRDRATILKGHTDSTNVLRMLDLLEKKFKIYTSLVDQLQQLSATNYTDGKEFFTVTIEPYFRTNLLPLIEKVRNEIQQNHERKITSLNSELAQISQMLGYATIFALLIAISLTFFLYRSIANPLNKLALAAKNIAQGNLDDRIEYDSDDELGQLSRTFNNMAESLSRTTVSRDYVDSIIESMADLLIVTDINYKIIRINSAGLRMLGLQKNEVMGESLQSIFKDQQFFDIPEMDRNQSGQKGIQDAELCVGDDKLLPVNVSKGALRDRTGNVEGYVIVASDISSEKEAQDKIKQSLREKEVMLAEIHHRVKNNLAVISGLLQMQIWEAENKHAATALQESQFRVRSIALVHEKLYHSENLSYIKFDQYIRDLLQAVSSTYLDDSSNIRIETNLVSIALNVNQAIPCSLLLNELLINAFKHAFDGKQDGVITVNMSEQDGKVLLRVKDNGKGFPQEQEDEGSLGMSLIETLGKQLEGTVEFNNDEGAEIKILFEAEEVLG